MYHWCSNIVKVLKVKRTALESFSRHQNIRIADVKESLGLLIEYYGIV